VSRPTLRRITTYPVKSLDPTERTPATVVENGGLDGDREFALFDESGDYVNGKATAAVHRLRSEFDAAAGTLTVTVPDGDSVTAPIDDERGRDRLAGALGDFLDRPVQLRSEARGGFPDDRRASGPTVVSTATLETVASWFPALGVESVRRRFRANLEIGSVEPFWEDRLFADRDHVVAFDVGDVRFHGVGPCQRCVVPTRDPWTGEPTPDFRETFVRKRRETLPAWSGGERFDHAYRLTVNTRVPESSWGGTLSVGDEVRIVGERPVEQG
jgi:hypothetical protein